MSTTVAKFSCPKCGAGFRWKPELAGKKVRCKCAAVIDIPVQPPEASEPAEIEVDAPGETRAASLPQRSAPRVAAAAPAAPPEPREGDTALPPPTGPVLHSLDIFTRGKLNKRIPWVLDLMEDRAVLWDESDHVVVQIPLGEVDSKIELPSFSKSTKHLNITTLDGVLAFEIGKPELAHLKTFMNRGIAAGGPESVKKLFNAAVRDTVIGGLLTVAGIGIMMLNMNSAANSGKGRIRIGLLIFGLIILGKGIYGFTQHAKVKAMSEENPAD